LEIGEKPAIFTETSVPVSGLNPLEMAVMKDGSK
jgi:hypothetical protein